MPGLDGKRTGTGSHSYTEITPEREERLFRQESAFFNSTKRKRWYLLLAELNNISIFAFDFTRQ